MNNNTVDSEKKQVNEKGLEDEDDFDRRLEALRQKIEGDKKSDKFEKEKPEVVGDMILKNYAMEDTERHIPLFIEGVEAPNLGDLDFGEIPHFVGFQ